MVGIFVNYYRYRRKGKSHKLDFYICGEVCNLYLCARNQFWNSNMKKSHWFCLWELFLNIRVQPICWRIQHNNMDDLLGLLIYVQEDNVWDCNVLVRNYSQSQFLQRVQIFYRTVPKRVFCYIYPFDFSRVFLALVFLLCA